MRKRSAIQKTQPGELEEGLRTMIGRVWTWSLLATVAVFSIWASRLGTLRAQTGFGTSRVVVARSALPAQVADTIRIVAYNIHHGAGMDERLDLQRIATIIADLRPDIVALQEVDRFVERTDSVDQAAVLSDLTGLASRFGMFMTYQGGEYGMAVLSAWPIVSVRNHRLPDGEEPRSALAVRVRSPNTRREVEFVGIHLYRTEGERLAQAGRLVEIYASEDTPSILAGDFNSLPASPVIELLSASWRFVEKGDDRFTFPSMAPAREIDFFAYRPAASFQILSQHMLDEPVASDHRPLFAELVWH